MAYFLEEVLSKFLSYIENIILNKFIFTIFYIFAVFTQYYLPAVEITILPYIVYPWALVLFFNNINEIKKISCIQFSLLKAFFILSILLNVYHLFKGNVVISESLSGLYDIFILIFVIYPPFKTYGEHNKYIQKVFAFVLVFFSILSVFGILSAHTGLSFTLYEDFYVGIDNNLQRLYVFSYPNNVAIIALLNLFIAMYFINLTNKGLTKALLVISMLINLYEALLTQTRTFNFILVGAIFLYCAYIIYNKIKVKQILAAIISVLLALSISVCSYLLMNYITGSFYINYNKIENDKNNQITYNIVPAAIAEETNLKNIKNNVVENTRLKSISKDILTLTGRTDIWLSAIKGIKDHPFTLIHGTLDGYVMSLGYKYIQNKTHTSLHNSYLHILISRGIFALVIFIFLLISSLIESIKYCLSEKYNKNAMLILIALISFCAIGFVESILITSNSVVNLMFFLFISLITTKIKEAKNV